MHGVGAPRRGGYFARPDPGGRYIPTASRIDSDPTVRDRVCRCGRGAFAVTFGSTRFSSDSKPSSSGVGRAAAERLRADSEIGWSWTPGCLRYSSARGDARIRCQVFDINVPHILRRSTSKTAPAVAPPLVQPGLRVREMLASSGLRSRNLARMGCAERRISAARSARRTRRCVAEVVVHRFQRVAQRLTVFTE